MLNPIQWISLGIVLLGLFIFLFQVFRRRDIQQKEVAEPIKEYKKARNKLTTRKEEDNEDEDFIGDGGLARLFGSLVGAGICLYVGMTVLDSVSETLVLESTTSNSTNVGLAGYETINTVQNWLPIISITFIIGMILFPIINVFKD